MGKLYLYLYATPLLPHQAQLGLNPAVAVRCFAVVPEYMVFFDRRRLLIAGPSHL